MKCIFSSDLHGHTSRYRSLFEVVSREQPDAVFLGGDLFPSGFGMVQDIPSFMETELFGKIRSLKNEGLNTRFFVIMGNDDPRAYEHLFRDADDEGVIDYVHDRTVPFGDLFVTGYSFVPPTPFLLKDWERYDVSRFVDVGAVSPEEGMRSVEVPVHKTRDATMKNDIRALSANSPPEKTIFLFHSPPYQSNLDRAALDGKVVDHAQLDVHVGSIAIQRFIEKEQPLLTLHGHIHESASITGSWRDRVGGTHSFSAAHSGPELAIIRFDTERLDKAERDLIPTP